MKSNNIYSVRVCVQKIENFLEYICARNPFAVLRRLVESDLIVSNRTGNNTGDKKCRRMYSRSMYERLKVCVQVFGIQLVDLADAFGDFKIKKDTPTLIYTYFLGRLV